MEVASRSLPEPLSDLPVEVPPDAGRAAPPEHDPAQTSLNFVDPDLFAPAAAQNAAGSAVPTPPEAPAGPASVAGRGTPAAPELTLEDPVVDEILSSPVAAPPVPAKSLASPAPLELISDSPRPTADKPVTDKPAAGADESVRSSRVPIARTAALSAATTRTIAAKLAAANKGAPATPAIPAVKPVASRAAPIAGAETTAKSGAARLDAPSFANWASARASVAPAAVASPAVVTVTKPPAPVPSRPAAITPVVPVLSAAPAPALPAVVSPTGSAAATAAPATAADVASSSATPSAPATPMDRDFIARNQVVERYLSGRLPLRGATDFERFCHEHPELLDEIGLPARVNAGLRLLEASGKPEPWQEEPRPFWDKPQVTLGLAAAAAVLAIGLGVAVSASVARSHQIENLKKQVAERALDPAVSTREIRLLPSRTGASNTPAITIGGNSAGAELAVLKIDESRSPYHAYRVTIDRIDQGRVGVISNLGKDSNGLLRIALNSSTLGPGNYQFTIEGMDWRGDPTPDSWITVGVQ